MKMNVFRILVLAIVSVPTASHATHLVADRVCGIERENCGTCPFIYRYAIKENDAYLVRDDYAYDAQKNVVKTSKLVSVRKIMITNIDDGKEFGPKLRIEDRASKLVITTKITPFNASSFESADILDPQLSAKPMFASCSGGFTRVLGNEIDFDE